MIIKYISPKGQNCTFVCNKKQGSEFITILVMNKSQIVEVKI